MLVYWRFIIAFIAVSITSVVFFYLVKLSIYDIKYSDTLPLKGIKDIPPSDTILPNIFAQIPLALPPTETTQPTVNSTNNLKTFNIEVTPQQCFEYAKECRDIQCAFQDFNVICNKNNNGPVCTCGTSNVSSASSILPNALLSIFISFVIPLYYYI